MAAPVHLALAHRAQRTLIALGVAALSSGCDLRNAPVLDPKGPIALAERDLLFTALAMMLIVVIPVFVMAFLFAWRYRASNTSARYTPDWAYSGRIDAIIWLVPALIVASLGALLWHSTHKLDPYRAIDPVIAPLEVQVVAQDWKWLFIYPALGVASVNQLVFPSSAPLSLKITSDTVMNSFYVPALGGQIYAMAGMETRLNLKADAPGRFTGRNAQYSGAGFSDQHFQVIAASAADFDAWLGKVRQAPEKLDGPTYRALTIPTRGHPVTYYSGVEPNLFGTIIAKYMRGHAQGNDHAAPESTNAR
jgi:cytochrome o ubiquinol oxidase subunit II